MAVDQTWYIELKRYLEVGHVPEHDRTAEWFDQWWQFWFMESLHRHGPFGDEVTFDAIPGNWDTWPHWCSHMPLAVARRKWSDFYKCRFPISLENHRQVHFTPDVEARYRPGNVCVCRADERENCEWCHGTGVISPGSADGADWKKIISLADPRRKSLQVNNTRV